MKINQLTDQEIGSFLYRGDIKLDPLDDNLQYEVAEERRQKDDLGDEF